MTPTIVSTQSGEERLRELLREGLDIVAFCTINFHGSEREAAFWVWIAKAREACK